MVVQITILDGENEVILAGTGTSIDDAIAELGRLERIMIKQGRCMNCGREHTAMCNNGDCLDV